MQVLENAFIIRYVSKGKPADKKRCEQTLRTSSEAEHLGADYWVEGRPDYENVHKESICSYSTDFTLIFHKRGCLEQYILIIINSSLWQKLPYRFLNVGQF